MHIRWATLDLYEKKYKQGFSTKREAMLSLEEFDNMNCVVVPMTEEKWAEIQESQKGESS
jgi:hypothetical protein